MGSAVSNGTNSVGTAAHVAGMNLATWTWAGWVKRTGVGEGDFRLMNKAATSAAGPLQVTGQSGGGALRGRQTRPTTSIAISLGDVMPLDTWVCLFVVFNGADAQGIRLYTYNGSAVVEMSYSSITNGSGAATFNTEALRIFNTTDGSLTYQGKAAYWALTPDIWSNANMLSFATGTKPVGLTDHFWALQADGSDSGEVGGWTFTLSNVTFDGADSPPVSYGGGVSTELSATDTIGVADTATTVVSAVRNSTDAIGVVDSATTASGPVLSATDPASVADTVAVSFSADETATDSIGITDSVTAEMSRVIEITDTIGVTDEGGLYSAEIVASVADPLAVADTADVTTDDTATTTDVVGVADTVSTAAVKVVDVTDAIGIADSAPIEGADSFEAIDSVGIAEAVITGASVVISIIDSVTAVDSVGPVSDVAVTATDIAGVSDNTSVDFATEAVDTIGVVDVVDSESPESITVTISDQVAVSESVGIVAQRIYYSEGPGTLRVSDPIKTLRVLEEE